MKGEAFYQAKKEEAKAKAEVLKDPKVVEKIAQYQQIIESYGHQ